MFILDLAHLPLPRDKSYFNVKNDGVSGLCASGSCEHSGQSYECGILA